MGVGTYLSPLVVNRQLSTCMTQPHWFGPAAHARRKHQCDGSAQAAFVLAQLLLYPERWSLAPLGCHHSRSLHVLRIFLRTWPMMDDPLSLYTGYYGWYLPPLDTFQAQNILHLPSAHQTEVWNEGFLQTVWQEPALAPGAVWENRECLSGPREDLVMQLLPKNRRNRHLHKIELQHWTSWCINILQKQATKKHRVLSNVHQGVCGFSKKMHSFLCRRQVILISY